MNFGRAIKIDIKDFYPSVRRKLVRDFFINDMQCAPDIAYVLSLLCCVKDSLPTGSPLSPVLSYFACSRLFCKIAHMAAVKNLKFTLYVDDMVFSGANATRSFCYQVVKELAYNGFIGHKITRFSSRQVKVITGVAVWPHKIGIPHKRQKRIRFFERAFKLNNNPDEIKILGGTLIGQYREAERLQPGSSMRARPIQERLDLINLQCVSVSPVTKKRRRRRLSSKLSKGIIDTLQTQKNKKKNDISSE